LFVAVLLDAHRQVPARIVLDLEATDDPLHGHQEGRYFHGYHDATLAKRPDNLASAADA
jgi:hypothetical protein